MTSIEDSRVIADAINARNARTMRWWDSAGSIAVALLIAICGALALLAFGTPCAEASLCMVAAARPTRPGLLRRLLMAAKLPYLRMLLRAAEQDAEWHAETARLAPQLEQLAKQRADELRIQIIDVELYNRA